MLVLDATVVNVALPRIDADLGFGPASLSWVLNAYTLAFGGLLLLGGRLGDVRGRLRVFEAGLAVFVLGSLLGGLAPNAGAPRRRPRPPGRRCRAGRPERAGPAHHQRPRRRGAQPRAGAVRRGLLRRRLDRAAAGRPADRPRLVALGHVHQRADRHGGARPRPAVRRRDRAPPRPLRRRRRRDRHRRRRLARLGADRHARPRLDLGPDARRASPSAWSRWRPSPSPSAGWRTR